MTVVPVLLAFGVALWGTHLLVSAGVRLGVLDYPNERSLHSIPTPRTGGLAICVAIAIATASLIPYVDISPMSVWLVAGALLVAAVSFADDRFTLGALYRICAHLAAAGLLAYGGYALTEVGLPGWQWRPSGVVAIGLTLLFTVWMTNLYNFMDGMDGFAGGMTVAGFGAFGVLGWVAGEPVFAALSWIIAGAAVGFLVWNFPPARIFMGDTGSSTLGFLAAGFTLWASRHNVFPIWVALLVFSPFVVDATITLMRRLYRREKVWEAHKSHYYQRMVQLGWGHRRTVLIEYVLMLGCSFTAIAVYSQPAAVQWASIVFWAIAYIGFLSQVRRLEA